MNRPQKSTGGTISGNVTQGRGPGKMEISSEAEALQLVIRPLPKRSARANVGKGKERSAAVRRRE